MLGIYYVNAVFVERAAIQRQGHTLYRFYKNVFSFQGLDDDFFLFLFVFVVYNRILAEWLVTVGICEKKRELWGFEIAMNNERFFESALCWTFEGKEKNRI